MSLGRSRVRLFVIKEGDVFEVLRHEFFEEKLLSSPTSPVEKYDGRWTLGNYEMISHETMRLTDSEWAASNISNIGWDSIEDDILKILESYKNDDVVEILADYVMEGFYTSSHVCGDDYDENSWLENIQHNKLRDPEIERFIGPFKRDKDGLIEFDKNVFSFNHGEQ